MKMTKNVIVSLRAFDFGIVLPFRVSSRTIISCQQINHVPTLLTNTEKFVKNALEPECAWTHFSRYLKTSKYISDANISKFSVCVRSIGTWFTVGRNSQF